MSTQDPCDSPHDLVENFGFATYFNHLMKTKKYIDVTFVLETGDGEVEFSAHQLVLAMRSAYFADMFYGDQKKKGNKTILLENANAKAFEDMIRYCYGRKPYFEAIEEVSTLFKVAYEFKVISLVNLCRTYLMNIKITPENTFSMLELSEYTKDKKLRGKCYKFLEEKTKNVVESYEMTQVTHTMVHIILDLQKLSLNSEYELIKWLIDWANAKVQEGDAVCRNAKGYLKNYLKYMNFLSLTFEEFATLCKDYPDFFTSQEIASIYVNIAHLGTRKMPKWYNKEIKIRKYTGREIKAEALTKMEGLTQLLENVSAIDKKLKESRMELTKCFIKNYRTFNRLKASKEVRERLKEIVGKDEKFEASKKRQEKLIQEAREQLKTMKEILEDDKELEDDEEFTAMKEMLENDEEHERMRTLLEIGEEFERISEILENPKEYERIKEMLEIGEEEFERMRELLENGENVCNVYKDFKSINESLKDLRSEVIQEIIKLR